MNPEKTSAADAGVRPRAAFTLLELVVVLATVGLLVVMVLPALAGTKPNSKLFQCMNNLKQLATAWTMYADDNNDLLCNLSTYGSGTVGVPWRTQISQVTTPLPAGITANTAAAQKYLTQMGFKQPTPTVVGPLFAYTPNVDLVHCPADFRANLAVGIGYRGPYSWDSYCGSEYLNGEGRGGANNLSKRSNITRPSDKWIWTEAAALRGENVGGWYMSNDGTAAYNFTDAQFGDSPAAFHVAASDFNFADGHVESHKWLDPTTVAYANYLGPNVGMTEAAAQHAGNVDAIWCARHQAGNQNP